MQQVARRTSKLGPMAASLSDASGKYRRRFSGSLLRMLRSLRFCRRDTTKQIWQFHPPAVFLKARARSLPTKILDGIEDGHIQAQGCKGAKQQSVVPRAEERFREQPGF